MDPSELSKQRIQVSYAMRHILYIAILRVFEKKTEPTDVCSANAQSDAWEHRQTPFCKNPYNNHNLNL